VALDPVEVVACIAEAREAVSVKAGITLARGTPVIGTRER
jgi:hypothetical protein